MRTKTFLLLAFVIGFVFLMSFFFEDGEVMEEEVESSSKLVKGKNKQQDADEKIKVSASIDNGKVPIKDKHFTSENGHGWQPFSSNDAREFDLKSPRGFMSLSIFLKDQPQNYKSPLIDFSLTRSINDGHKEEDSAHHHQLKTKIHVNGKMGMNMVKPSSNPNQFHQKRDLLKIEDKNRVLDHENLENENSELAIGEIGRDPLSLKRSHDSMENNNRKFNAPRIQDPDLAMILKDKMRKEYQASHPTIWVKMDGRPVESHFKSVMGVHDLAVVSYVEVNVTIGTSHDSCPYIVQVRLYDDAMAFRYLSNPEYQKVDNEDESRTLWKVMEDYSSWNLDPTWDIWAQENVKYYEGIYEKKEIGDMDAGRMFGPPLTAQSTEPTMYVTITEANLVDFSGMSLLKGNERGVFKANFVEDPDGWIHRGIVVSPWRVTLIADNLNELVNSDVIESLAPPPSVLAYSSDLPDGEFDLEDQPWIKTGRSLWHWWSTGDPVLSDQKNWINAAQELGFEFYLIDDGWQKWKDTQGDEWNTLQELVEYADGKGVKIWIWVHHKFIFDKFPRLEFFKKAKEAGVVGIKIDFMNNESFDMIKWYEETLQDSAKLKLMVNFHGANKPTGRRRTWPHEMTREGVRGHEYHILRYKRTLPPQHDAALPFTRFIAGPGDYTPTVFNKAELRGFTWSRELAQAIVFTSPIIHYADNYELYLKNPLRDIMKNIPSTWDETKVLEDSKIGELAGFARRKGKVWFVGIISGLGKVHEIILDCSEFLTESDYQAMIFSDDDDVIRKQSVSQDEQLVVDFAKSGGFVAMFTPH